MQANVYFCFNGNCEEAMNRYAEVLGGHIMHVSKMGDAPMPVEEKDKNRILHASMSVADTIFMFSDSNDQHKVTFGNAIAVSLNCKSEGEVDKLFGDLSEGGVSTMAPENTFWGAYFAMCTDKFGTNWMFNYDKPQG